MDYNSLTKTWRNAEIIQTPKPENTGYNKLVEMQSELQKQTEINTKHQYQFEKLNAQIQNANKMIDEQNEKLEQANELNVKLNSRILLLENQIEESTRIKLRDIIISIICGGLGGLLTAILEKIFS